MNPERRRVLEIGVLTATSLVLETALAACQRIVSLPEKSPSPSPTSDILQVIARDSQIEGRLRAAKRGQSLILNDVMVSYINRNLGDLFYTVGIGIQEGPEKISNIARIITRSSCVFDALESQNALGKPKGVGEWEPRKRVDSLVVKVILPFSRPISIPDLSVEKVSLGGKIFECK